MDLISVLIACFELKFNRSGNLGSEWGTSDLFSYLQVLMNTLAHVVLLY